MAPQRGVPDNTGRKTGNAVKNGSGAMQLVQPLIVNNNEFAMAGNFACNDNGVRRQSPQITMNINARTMAGLPTVGAALVWPSDHNDQTKTRRGVPAGHSSRVSISRIV
jgi:hypothetical protein